MALSIPVPEGANTIQEVALGGFRYIFEYSFNDRDQRWRLSISLSNTVVVSGIKIMENQSLLSDYSLDDFSHGDLYCVRIEDDGKFVGRDNLGQGKPYEIFYLTNEEIAEL